MSLTPQCDTKGCKHFSVHAVGSLSGVLLRLCARCYDRWWETFGRKGAVSGPDQRTG